jgi:hypothetical protein
MARMAGGRSALLGLLLLVLTGCANSLPEQTSALMPRRPANWAAPDAESLQIEIGLLRQPLGDRYFNQDVWKQVDELALSLDRRLALEANGIRAGIISGNTPAELQALLTSKKTCVQSRRITLRNGHEHFLTLAPDERPLVLHVIDQGETVAQDFADALCGLALRFELADAGKVRIKCEPRVRHGEAQRGLKPAADRSDWTLSTGRPEEKYPSLAWELVLSTTEYGIVGGLLDREQSLGFNGFTKRTNTDAYQYLLVIRSVRPQIEAAAAVLNADGKSALKEPPPLALQSIAKPKTPPPPSTRSQSP